VSGHLVTMDVHAGTDYAVAGDHVTGSFIAGSLSDSDSEHLALGGMTLATLHGLGVDVIDIVGNNGAQGDYTVHINGPDISAMAAANVGYKSSQTMHFAAADTIKLDLVQGTSPDFSSIAPEKAFAGLSVTQLGDMGVDEVHVSGLNQANQGNFTLHIDAAPTLFTPGPQSNDYVVSLDVPLAAGQYDGHGNGSHLAASLDGTDIGGLTLLNMSQLGVDVIDIVGSNGADGDFTAHVSVAETDAMKMASLVFASGDHIVENVSANDLAGSSSTSAEYLKAAATNLSNLGVDAVQFADGAEIALGGDHGLVNLLMSLSSPAAEGNNRIAAVASDNITVSDSMVKALLDAGIFTADTASTIKVDASADTDGHVATTLAQLAHIGADQVVVAEAVAVAYVDLGNVTNAAELTALFTSLNASQPQPLVTDAQDVEVSTSLLLTSEQAAALTSLIGGSNDTELSNIGIKHVYAPVTDPNQYAQDDLILGTEHYKEVHSTPV